MPPSTFFSFIACIFCAQLNNDDSSFWCVFVEAVHVLPLCFFLRSFSLSLFSPHVGVLRYVTANRLFRVSNVVIVGNSIACSLVVWSPLGWLASTSAERWARAFSVGRHLLCLFVKKDGAPEGNGVFIDWFGCWEALPWEPLPLSSESSFRLLLCLASPLCWPIGVFCLCSRAMPLVGDRGRNGLNLWMFLVSLSSPFLSWLGSKSDGALGLPSPSARVCSESDLGPVAASSL